MTLLRVDSLNIAFRSPHGEIPVLNDISFDLDQGETLALVGESGSGKTICASALIGLLPPAARITGGRILFRERDLARIREKQWRTVRGRDISMVFQDPSSVLNPVLTIGTQLTEAIRAHQSLSRTQAQRLAVELLDQVGLARPAERMRDYPHQLSGGMRQRVVIAMAVANRPRLIIADEATTALDATVQRQIVQLMQSLCKQSGSSLLWISHDLALVAEIAERVMVMYAGQIVEQGPVAQTLFEPLHPYTDALVRAHPGFAAGNRPLVALPGDTQFEPSDRLYGCVFRTRCPRSRAKCLETPSLAGSDNVRQARCWFPLPDTDDGGDRS